MKKRYLGLLGLPMLMAQCQPACTPGPTEETPVVEETTVPAPVETQPPVTVPVIPLHVTVTRECQDYDPAFSVVNDSDQPVVFTWTAIGHGEQQHTLAGGTSMLQEWPQSIIGDGPLSSFTWTASANGATFDQGTLYIDGGVGLADCDADFSATLLTACYTTSGINPGVYFYYDVTSPVGYDSVDFSAVVGGPNLGAPTFADWEDPLPQVSTNQHFIAGTFGDPLAVSTRFVTFYDDDGLQPAHTLLGTSIAASRC